jgi:hypothetical protein
LISLQLQEILVLVCVLKSKCLGFLHSEALLQQVQPCISCFKVSIGFLEAPIKFVLSNISHRERSSNNTAVDLVARIPGITGETREDRAAKTENRKCCGANKRGNIAHDNCGVPLRFQYRSPSRRCATEVWNLHGRHAQNL